MPSDSAMTVTHPRTEAAPVVRRIALLCALAALSALAFLTLGVPKGALEFALKFRAEKLVGLILVAFAIAASTQLFHTATRNRILTPAIMGFDALYLMIQTSLVYGLGAIATLSIPIIPKFFFEVVAMMSFSTGLFLWLFTTRGRDLHLLILVGIIFGTLFRSLSGFVARMIDPNEFVVVQSSMFASFNTIDSSLLGIGVFLCAICVPVLWIMRHQFDILALGRETAINLGLHYRRVMFISFALIGLLVSVSTALVGPVTFFGLLVTHLAYLILPGARFAPTMFASLLIAIITLVGGQAIYEHVLNLKGTLSVVIELAGGLVFLFLLLRGVKK